MTLLQTLLLFCDRIGGDFDYIMCDSRIIDNKLVGINKATALADGWDWSAPFSIRGAYDMRWKHGFNPRRWV